jgi:hypothetical protein
MEHNADDTSLPTPTPESLAEESLTDVIDQWRRAAFRQALERRHVTPAHRTVVDTALVVRTKSQ